MRQRKMCLVAVMAGCLLVLPSAAFADEPCLLPVGCAAPLDLDLALDPDGAVDDPVGTVTDVVGGAEETVEPVVGPVRDLIDDVLGGEDPVEPPGDGPGDGRGTVVEGRTGSRDPSAGRDPSAERGPFFDGLVREDLRPDTLIGSAASGTRPIVGPAGVPGGPGVVVGAALRGLLLLAVLFGIAVGFVLVQSRIDRRDPRLAESPARAELVTFA